MTPLVIGTDRAADLKPVQSGEKRKSIARHNPGDLIDTEICTNLACGLLRQYEHELASEYLVVKILRLSPAVMPILYGVLC
jgi:hypothetical protein